MRVVGLSCVSLALVVSAAAAQTRSTGSAERCAALSQLRVPGVTVAVDRAEWHAAGPFTPTGPIPMPPVDLPAYCRLDATIDRRVGVGSAAYGIGLALALPDDWNGRFLMQGGGGLNGSVATPLGAVAAGDRPGLARGFAVVTTDTGHQGAVFDPSFMRDQQAALDFAYVAIGRVALFAKAVIAQYYGRPADRSYYAGCSTGGREGMVMAQRYPTYFDGIVSGAPAMRTGHSNLGLRWMAAAFNRIAPKDSSGHPVRAQAFSDADRKRLVNGLLAACDARDGLADGVVADATGCAFDPSVLQCSGPKADGCLSTEQVEAIRQAFAGPKDGLGRQVYPAFPYDTGIVATGFIPGILSPGAGPPGPPVLGLQVDVDREVRRVETDAQAILTDTWSWTNLSTFSGRGGKLIFYHGVSDPWFSALDTLDYYTRLQAANGGAAQVMPWSRLFLVPGMGHCGGGASGVLDSFDLLSAAVEWTEKDTAPEAVRATSRTAPGRSRPLCPHPMHAHYTGQGDGSDAASFECRQP